jgi:hypothetical protein
MVLRKYSSIGVTVSLSFFRKGIPLGKEVQAGGEGDAVERRLSAPSTPECVGMALPVARDQPGPVTVPTVCIRIGMGLLAGMFLPPPLPELPHNRRKIPGKSILPLADLLPDPVQGFSGKMLHLLEPEVECLFAGLLPLVIVT